MAKYIAHTGNALCVAEKIQFNNMEYPKFYCPNCGCETPHDIEKISLNPTHNATRIALAVFSLGASEIIPSPNQKYLVYDEVQTTSTCLSCGKKVTTTKYE